MIVWPEPSVMIVQAAGKNTSTPGMSPGSKEHDVSSGCWTNAAAEAGEALKTETATAAKSANTAVMRRRITYPFPVDRSVRYVHLV